MINQVQEFVAGRTAAAAVQARKLMQEPIAAAREVAVDSAEGLKSLKAPVRAVARSGVKVTAVSQNALQSLIELQAEAIQTAISDAALRLERASRAASLLDLVRAQVELIPATRERVVDDARRVVHILRGAGRELGTIAVHTYERVTDADEAPAKVAKRAPRKTAKKAVRKTRKAA
jgi:phasin family protein